MTLSNNPPPEAAIGLQIDDLYAEAQNFLDGGEIQNEGQAEAVGAIIDQMRKLSKQADDARKAEKKPHDDAGKAVQAKWKPIIDKADLAVTTAKKPVAAFLARKEAEQRAHAAEMARKAEAAAAEARRLAAETDQNNLHDAAAIVQAEEDAAKLARISKAEGNRKTNLATGGRAIGLRSYWTAEVTNPGEFLRYLKETQPDAVKAWLGEFAQSLTHSGKRSIPGVNITEERRAA